MPRHPSALLLLAFFVLISGCGVRQDAPAPQSPAPRAAFTAAPAAAAAPPPAAPGATLAQRERWAAAGIDHYRWRGSTGDMFSGERFEILVSDGEVIDSSCVVDFPSSDEPCTYFEPERYTVEGVFAAIDEASSGRGVTAEYDPEFGYPLKLVVPVGQHESVLAIESFEPLDAEAAPLAVRTPTPAAQPSADLQRTLALADAVTPGRLILPPAQVAWTPDGQTVLAWNRLNVVAWRIDSGETIDGSIDFQSEARQGGLEAATLSPDGAALAVVRSSTIQLWRIADMAVMRTFSAPLDFGRLRYARFGPRPGWLYAGPSDDGQEFGWDLGAAALEPVADAPVETASPDGRRAVVDSSRQELRSLPDNALITELAGSSGSLTFNHDGTLLAGRNTRNTNELLIDELFIWDAADGSVLFHLPYERAIDEIRFDPTGAWMVTAQKWQGDSLTVRQASDGAERYTLVPAGPGDGLRAWSISPDGALLAIAGGFRREDEAAPASPAGDRDIQLWDLASGRLLRTLTGHADDVGTLAFSPAGDWLASGGDDQTLRLWRIK